MAGAAAAQPASGGTSPAGSADPASTQAHGLAVNLFDQGVALGRDGGCDASPVGNVDKCRAARDLFRRAYAIDGSAIGALRNLCQVERALGLSASAAGHLRDLIRKAPADANPTRRAWASWASDELPKVLPSVSHLTIVVTPASDAVTVRLDDARVPAPAWGAPMEADPGSHTLAAEGSGFAPFEESVTLEPGASRTVRVTLTPAPAAPSAITAPTAPAVTPGADSHSDSGARSPLPWVVMGVGGAAIGVGAVYGVLAINQHSTACPGGGNVCNDAAYRKGLGDADASTVLFISGGAVVAAGLLWEILLPPSRPSGQGIRVHPVLTGAGGGVAGTF
jgi:hypothetical protein